MRWCAENFKVEDKLLSKDPYERFEIALKIEKEVERSNYLEDNSLIAYALRFAFETLKGQTLEGETTTGERLEKVIIDNVIDIEPKSKNQGWINFKLIGKEKDKVFKIGVTVLQFSNGRAVGAGIARLIEYKTFDITRGCLVRSKDKKIRKNWDSYPYLNKLVQELGGEWVYLQNDEIRPLIDLYSVYQKRNNYQLNEQQVLEFSQKLTRENPLLLEILSDPSGQIDAEAVEGEELLNDFLNPTSKEESDDLDDLSELFS